MNLKTLPRPVKRSSVLILAARWLSLLLILATAACNLPSIPATPQAQATTAAGAPAVNPLPPQPQTQVNFRVQVPDNTPSDAAIYLAVLDEVTGLALNSQRYTMEAEDTGVGPARVFSLSLTLPVGTAVQYRYERQAGKSASVIEHVSDGRPVRYRLFHVEGPGTVQDIVSRWTDTPFSGSTGRIMGQATDAASGQPLPGLLVTAGGAQVLTNSDGSFLLEGLPPGLHNLVAFALDGSYRTYQQGAQVAAESTTPAVLKLSAAPPVKIAFVVTLPADTPPVVPVRLAGSLYQLGNTFANLAGGSSALAERMPTLSPLPDRRYTLTLTLPAGADIRYKYTLGDGFWNAEHTSAGEFRLRQLVVPENSALIQDVVDTWHSGSQGSLTFDLTVPANTPPGESVSIQFNPLFGWTEPIPMWSLGNNRWAYILFSPLNLPGQLSYRYCRNSQCGATDAADTIGVQNPGHPAKIGSQPQTIRDQVSAWAWLEAPSGITTTQAVQANPRGPSFLAGVELQAAYHPSWKAYLPAALDKIKALGANTLILAPTWTYTRSTPPVLEPVPGSDALWLDLLDSAQQIQSRGLDLVIFPQPHFPVAADQWWKDAPRDFSWWTVWFEHYRAFALHHADLAARTNASTLILGGDWLAPALPGGGLADGTPSGLPADADTRWRSLLDDVRDHFKGKVYWALPVTQVPSAPAFLDQLDGVYLLWSAPLSKEDGAAPADLAAEAGRLLDSSIQPFLAALGKPLALGLLYPSAQGV
ncbi:MAG TPA: carboxypeptidase regulatory-like domain-containing protein, partial [Anaerolineales bacterium]